MMTKIKFALSFILGMLYMLTIHYVATFTGDTLTDINYNLSLGGVIIISIFIWINIILFFLRHWSDK